MLVLVTLDALAPPGVGIIVEDEPPDILLSAGM